MPPEEPVMFLKPNTAIIGPGVPILACRRQSGPLRGRAGGRDRPALQGRARRAGHRDILGYTIANDVSARDQQKKDGQWTRAKGLDTFCPLGPWIDTDLDPATSDLRTEVNGELVQHSRTSLMIHDIARSRVDHRGDDAAAR